MSQSYVVMLVLMPVAAFLIGGIPFGWMIGRAHGIDVRTAGSGNIGATNVGRVLGRRWGMLAFVLDVGKGLLPVLAAGWVIRRVTSHGTAAPLAAGDYLLWLVIGAACIFGHVFPVYLRFRGGKGVATSLGVVLGVWPYFTLPGFVAFGAWILVTLTTRYVSLGSICAVVVFPISFGLFHAWLHWPGWRDQWPLLLFAVFMAGVIVVRHRGNVRRLLAGREHRIGSTPRVPAEGQTPNRRFTRIHADRS